MGLTPVNALKLRGYTTMGDVELYDSAIKRFCKRENVRLVSMNEVLTIKDLEDGVHPTPSGHKKIANKIMPILEKYFRKP
ncbi:MAG: SGNH/GDSL hydrolase family protein [Patescibacteria group bacterium]|nr:hypothetical protein [Patescibacteria group bacterium]MDE2015765.1 SGNH/GDSL hydrolase family protein [Patescibacteria group bacterium]MDE2226822.1 SGNH/GDSL hydrolase family protein [Patescibacteria group bacterium]